jgi:hypothetical protein
MFAPDPRHIRRCQAGNTLIDLSEFPEPPLTINEVRDLTQARTINYAVAISAPSSIGFAASWLGRLAIRGMFSFDG